MTADVWDLEPFRTDVLFLLVGGNPLPNYVAAMLLVKEGGMLRLLHSKDTLGVATRLERKIREQRQDIQVCLLHEVDEADGESIRNKLALILQDAGQAGGGVGLNYTGGTKPMAVHSYHAVRETFPHAVFSYLDAGSLQMVFPRDGLPTQKLPVGRALEPSIGDLLDLHGYVEPDEQPRVPRPFSLCRAIASVHAHPQGFNKWREWTQTLGDMPALPPACTEFANVRRVLDELCPSGEANEAEVAACVGFPEFGSCSKFFTGEWLEDYTYHLVKELGAELRLHDPVLGIRPLKPPQRKGDQGLELDVGAMCGYQLLAISCQATKKREVAKDHLFELFVRARQLGGDEARFALVCCVDPVEPLEREVEQAWDAAGKIEVFGLRDLLNLKECLRQWFRKASKEGS